MSPNRLAAALSLTALLSLGALQEHPGQDRMQGMPDLVGALKKIKGCLGVETAGTSSGKEVVFAWFEDKKAVLRWYSSPTHRGVMRGFVSAGVNLKKPLEHIEDGSGPIMVVASLTMAEKPAFAGLALPVSQIAIELYQPLPGGSYLGSRFTPKSVPVAHSRDLGADMAKKQR